MLDAAEIIPEILNDIMEVEIERDEWDEAPMMFAILTPDPNSDDPDKFRVAPFGLTVDFWTKAPVHIMLGVMAEAITHPKAPDPPAALGKGDEVVAMMLRTEGWGFVADGATDEERKEMAEWAKTRAIVDHPRAVEVKMLTAVTLDKAYGVVYRRHDEKPIANTDETLEGRVPDGLLKMLQALRERLAR